MPTTTEIILQYVCPTLGVFTANFMCLAPLQDLQRAVSEGKGIGNLNPTPWAFMLGNFLGWTVCGILANDWFLFLADVPGMVVSCWLNLGAVKLLYSTHQQCDTRRSLFEYLAKASSSLPPSELMRLKKNNREPSAPSLAESKQRNSLEGSLPTMPEEEFDFGSDDGEEDDVIPRYVNNNDQRENESGDLETNLSKTKGAEIVASGKFPTASAPEKRDESHKLVLSESLWVKESEKVKESVEIQFYEDWDDSQDFQASLSESKEAQQQISEITPTARINDQEEKPHWESVESVAFINDKSVVAFGTSVNSSEIFQGDTGEKVFSEKSMTPSKVFAMESKRDDSTAAFKNRSRWHVSLRSGKSKLNFSSIRISMANLSFNFQSTRDKAQEFGEIIWNITSQKSQAKTPHEKLIMAMILIWTIVFSAIGFYNHYAPPPENGKERGRVDLQVTGYVVVSIQLFFYGAPLSRIGVVIKSRKSDILHVPSMITNSSNCLLWFAYGVCPQINDYFIYGPSGLGLFFGLVQFALLFIFPKSKQREDGSKRFSLTSMLGASYMQNASFANRISRVGGSGMQLSTGMTDNADVTDIEIGNVEGIKLTQKEEDDLHAQLDMAYGNRSFLF